MLAVHDPPAVDEHPTCSELIEIVSRALRKEFGTEFRFFDGRTGEPLADGVDYTASNGQNPADIVSTALGDRPRVRLLAGDRYQLSVPIHEPQGRRLVAVGRMAALARTPADQHIERSRIQSWLQSVCERVTAPARRGAAPRDDLSTTQQLASSLGAILKISDLLREFGRYEDARSTRHWILERAASVLPVEALLWIPAREDEQVLRQGDCHFTESDSRSLATILGNFTDRDSSGCILVSDTAACGLDVCCPGVRTLLAVPSGDPAEPCWLIALNKARVAGKAPHSPDASVAAHGGLIDPPFRRVDAALLMPFAGLLACQSRMDRRNSQVQQLFTGLANSLATAIDAKDSYTSGHSERVARVAVELGRELGLSEHELGDLYLGGLLHDIGKIGVRDSILFKLEPLTEDELREVREHVHIGCRILSDFRAIAHLLPMVLHHHERYDGTGYPHRLCGEEIPLLARILAVADSYDAMTTSRTYRAALPIQQTEEILRRGAGVQWDQKVVDAFFHARERIDGIQHRGVGESVCVALDGSFR